MGRDNRSQHPGQLTARRLKWHTQDDAIILMRTGRLQNRQTRTAWFRAVGAAGTIVRVWPLGANELPHWLEQRCRAAGLELTRDAIALLADSVEGNLLAALQEVQKLKLARS